MFKPKYHWEESYACLCCAILHHNPKSKFCSNCGSTLGHKNVSIKIKTTFFTSKIVDISNNDRYPSGPVMYYIRRDINNKLKKRGCEELLYKQDEFESLIIEAIKEYVTEVDSFKETISKTYKR